MTHRRGARAAGGSECAHFLAAHLPGSVGAPPGRASGGCFSVPAWAARANRPLPARAPSSVASGPEKLYRRTHARTPAALQEAGSTNTLPTPQPHLLGEDAWLRPRLPFQAPYACPCKITSSSSQAGPFPLSLSHDLTLLLIQPPLPKASPPSPSSSLSASLQSAPSLVGTDLQEQKVVYGANTKGVSWCPYKGST